MHAEVSKFNVCFT